MVPPFHPDTGQLPEAARGRQDEVVERFGWNPRRRQLLDGLADAIDALAAAGCRRLWLNGGFVTAKEEPRPTSTHGGDSEGVDIDALDPVLLDLSAGRAAPKARFGGELFPNVVEAVGPAFSEFFQNERGTGPMESSSEDRREHVITNEVQHRATKAHLRRFEEAAVNLAARIGADGASKLTQLELHAVRAQADDLRAEIDEYEQLRSGSVSIFEASSLAELATLLVKARIARGWTQSQLAYALGVAEQQVQRYESTAYRSASLARMCDVAAALEISISERAELRDRTRHDSRSSVA